MDVVKAISNVKTVRDNPVVPIKVISLSISTDGKDEV